MKALSAHAKKANESYQFKVNGICHFKVTAYQAYTHKKMNREIK